jgi:hypothetical protein
LWAMRQRPQTGGPISRQFARRASATEAPREYSVPQQLKTHRYSKPFT